MGSHRRSALRYGEGRLQSACSLRSIGLSFSPILEDRSGAILSRDVGGVVVLLPGGECRHHTFAAPLGVRGELADREQRRHHPDRTNLGLAQYGGGTISVSAVASAAISPISALLIDRDGSLWIGGTGTVARHSETGVMRFGSADGSRPAESPSFSRTRTAAFGRHTTAAASDASSAIGWRRLARRNGLPDNRVRTMYEDREGGLWVGTVASGVSAIS